MKDLSKLKPYTKNLSILYIESDLTLQREVTYYLKQVFKVVYQAHDGLDGYEEYKKNNPDIILTDLNLLKKNAFEMIVEIKNLNENVNIVVLSDKNDNFQLLESLDLGIIELLKKPFNLYQLKKALKKAPILHLNDDKCSQSQLLISDVLRNQKTVNCISNYKGIILTHSGNIIHCEDNKFTIKVAKTQLISAIYEKQMLIHINNKYILSRLLEIDKTNNILTLCEPKVISYTTRDNQNKRFPVDNSFKVSMDYKGKHYELKGIEISYKYLSIQNPLGFDIYENDSIELTLGFDRESPSSLIHEKQFTKIFAHGKIQRVENHKNSKTLIVELDIKKSGQNLFHKYIQQREIDIINEFKQKMKQH